jgi:acetyltransferase
VGSGFQGVVYPINQTSEAVMGIACYPDLSSLPRLPELAVICSPAEEVPGWIMKCGSADIFGIIIMSAGFKEAGEEGRKLEDQIKLAKQNFEQMRIIGPNCLGIIVPSLNLNVSFAPDLPQKGNIAFISQSGALCTSVLDWAREEKIGFSNFVSIGNTVDVDFGHLIDYFGEDESTKSILLYIESISNARKFMTASRAFARSKPIIAYKAGRFKESAAVAASHTGALASEDNVYDAAFQRIGLARVFDIGEIFDCAELIGRNRIPRGSNLAIVTNAGGPGVMATDALIEANGKLANLSEETLSELDQNLPPMWSHGNPVDVLGDARSKRLAKAVKIVLKDKNVDAVLVILTPQAMTNPTLAAEAIGALQSGTSKPILAAWLGGFLMKEGIRILADHEIANYKTPEQAVRAFMTLVAYARNLELLYETPREIPVSFSLDREVIRKEFQKITADKQLVLSEENSKKLLKAYGIPVSMPQAATDLAQAVEIAETIGYPVVMKILSDEITHKTDVGGVILNIKTADSVQKSYHKMIQKVKEINPEAIIRGVTIQPMIDIAESLEMILGIKRDPVFGTVIMVGSGGVNAELFADRTLGFPPLNERLARRMLEQLKIWPLLKGYRGKPALNIDRLIEIMIRLSYLAADYPEISELDINPLLVSKNEIIALDARIIIKRINALQRKDKYSHLALKPYPEEYEKHVQIADGTKVFLRPIKPEDEPLWLEMLSRCSKDSIYSRFRYFFQWDKHEVATRYCYIDYDREVAIVAEVLEEGKRKLAGVGRLIADPNLDSVEYAILIIDAWQNRDLGKLITDYCIEISEKWGAGRIVAQTTKDNHRMISVFQKRGFFINMDAGDEIVEVEKIVVKRNRDES